MEVLSLYLLVSPAVVSSTLIREDEGTQRLVYFTSKAFHKAEERYPWIKKLAFALVNSTRRLRLYFQAHTIKVFTEHPLWKNLQKLDISGRLVNWEIELGEFNVEFLPRNAIKGQVLAYFLVEFCNFPEGKELPQEDAWIAYVDGSST